MNTRPWRGIGLCLLVLILAAPGCGRKDAAPNAPPTETPVDEVDYEGLGLTSAEIQKLKQQGIANVDSAEVASRIAGFPVAVPAYIPRGFRGGKYSVTVSGAGLPEGVKLGFNNTRVQRIYTWQEDSSVLFFLVQTVHKFGLGEGEPYDVGGTPGERAYLEGNPQRGNPGPLVSFAWQNGGSYFSITGYLSGPIDEATLLKIAVSVDTK